jgi:DNA-binding XRE family transcriptional regulator/ribosomal protein S17E
MSQSGNTNNSDYLTVMSSLPYHATREALSKNQFKDVPNSPWPTAMIERTDASGYAQLRPAALDSQTYLPPEEEKLEQKLMWKMKEELSDLDADVLDSLSSLWLEQALNPQSDAVADVNDLLARRGLQPAKNKKQQTGGYRTEQKEQVMRALYHIQNVWLEFNRIKVFEGEKDKGQMVTRSIQSRAFVITDRMGQLKLDGGINVEKFIFRPGKIFANFLFGPGRQTALLAAKALEYDPYRQKYEKRLARYLSWQWRNRMGKGFEHQKYKVATLLSAIGMELEARYASRRRERFERILDTLQEDKVVAAWSYEGWEESQTKRRRWYKDWLQATITLEAPESILEQYFQEQKKVIEVLEERNQTEEPLHDRVKRHRKHLNQSQAQAAAELGISQSQYSRLERGLTSPRNMTVELHERIRTWLED